MQELVRKDIGNAPYAMYALGETGDIGHGFEGLHGAVIEAGLGDRFVRLTDGTEVGKLVEWGTLPFEPTAKHFTVITKAREDGTTPGYTVAGIIWRSKELRDLALDADLVIDRGVMILRGEEETPAAKTRFTRAEKAKAWA